LDELRNADLRTGARISDRRCVEPTPVIAILMWA
jgi:hypothetical protein